VAAPAGLDRYKELFSVLIRRIRITSIPVYITEEIKWNRKRSVVGVGEWSGRPGRRNPGKLNILNKKWFSALKYFEIIEPKRNLKNDCVLLSL
jgi:hypothetical protein